MKHFYIFFTLIIFSSCNSNIDVNEFEENLVVENNSDKDIKETEIDKSIVNTNEESVHSLVYVTYGGHIEDNPLYWQDCKYFEDIRSDLLDVANLVEEYQITFNLQVEYEFLKGIQNCETALMKENTSGDNILSYLVSNFDFEIDAHQEGAWDWEPDSPDNWADIHYLATQIVTEVSNVTGLVWDYPNQFDELNEGQFGRLHPEHYWQPMIIGSAVGYKHHLGDFSDDDVSSGMWKPKGGGDDFYIHDASKRMVYTGSGVHGNWGGTDKCDFRSPIDYIKVLQKYQAKGILDSNLMWTSNIYIPQKIMFSELSKFEEILKEGLVLDNIEYVRYTELVDIWFKDYDGKPSQLLFKDIDKEDFTCKKPMN